MYTIIFDWKRTLYDPDSKKLIKDVLRLLKFLKKKNANIVLIGKGGEEMYKEVSRLKIKKYFTKIIFQKGEKEKNLFIPFISKKYPKSTIIVGDRIRSEIEIGNQLKAFTVWIRQGKFSVELPISKKQKPDFIVNSINDLLEFFRKEFKSQIPV